MRVANPERAVSSPPCYPPRTEDHAIPTIESVEPVRRIGYQAIETDEDTDQMPNLVDVDTDSGSDTEHSATLFPQETATIRVKEVEGAHYALVGSNQPKSATVLDSGASEHLCPRVSGPLQAPSVSAIHGLSGYDQAPRSLEWERLTK